MTDLEETLATENVKSAGSKGGDGKKKDKEQITISKAEYDTLIQERDQAKINLFLLGNNLKESGFTVSEQGTAFQRLGNDIVSRIRLTPEQIRMMQQQQQQQQAQQMQQANR